MIITNNNKVNDDCKINDPQINKPNEPNIQSGGFFNGASKTISQNENKLTTKTIRIRNQRILMATSFIETSFCFVFWCVHVCVWKNSKCGIRANAIDYSRQKDERTETIQLTLSSKFSI